MPLSFPLPFALLSCPAPVRRAAAGLLALACAAPALISPALAAPPLAAPACYAPEALRARPGEEVVRRAAAPVSLPDVRLPPAQPVPASLSGSIRRVDLPAGVKLVALTFDLCEASGEVSGYDGALVDYLRAEHVPATFFGGGKWMISHPDRAAQILADPIFEMGNHTWSHANLAVKTGEAMTRQVDDADTAFGLSRATATQAGCMLAQVPARPALFRFPYGSCNAESMNYGGIDELRQRDRPSGDPVGRGFRRPRLPRRDLDGAEYAARDPPRLDRADARQRARQAHGGGSQAIDPGAAGERLWLCDGVRPDRGRQAGDRLDLLFRASG
ncbi:MAG: hypothetical protein B7Z41_04185 [Rhizobiales bacterium 12-66-7]|nr:MAG: hypothetical protein B7Z41_04185 [Rhizobiales bacterium 12-66-7]